MPDDLLQEYMLKREHDKIDALETAVGTVGGDDVATQLSTHASQLAAKANMPLNDKTVVVMSDSIHGLISDETGVCAKIAEITGATVHNLGFGGTMMAARESVTYDKFSMYRLADALVSRDFTGQDAAVAQSQSFPSYFGTRLALMKTIDFSEVDVLVIMYGQNDHAFSVLIDNASDVDDYNTFSGALRYSLNVLLAAYPNLRVVLATPAWCFYNVAGVYSTNSDLKINLNGDLLAAYATAVNVVGDEYHLQVVDNYNAPGINVVNRLRYFDVSDGIHHNAVGRAAIGENEGRAIGSWASANDVTRRTKSDVTHQHAIYDIIVEGNSTQASTPTLSAPVSVASIETSVKIRLADGTYNLTTTVPLKDTADASLHLRKIESYIDRLYKDSGLWKHGAKTAAHQVVEADCTGYYTTYTNLDYLGVNKPADYAGYNNANNVPILFTAGQYADGDGAWDNAAKVNHIYTSATTTKFYVGFPKGTTLAAMKAAVIGQTIYYPLAVEVVSTLSDAAQNALNGLPMLPGTISATSLNVPAATITVNSVLDVIGYLLSIERRVAALEP